MAIVQVLQVCLQSTEIFLEESDRVQSSMRSRTLLPVGGIGCETGAFVASVIEIPALFDRPQPLRSTLYFPRLQPNETSEPMDCFLFCIYFRLDLSSVQSCSSQLCQVQVQRLRL
jgi:hypothetical protein